MASHLNGSAGPGMPKTIDNDVVPIWLSLGAWTAAEQVGV